MVHYSVMPGDTNAVSTFDGDANGTPDYIDTVLTTIEYVWNYEVSTMGYTAPPPDSGGGGDDRYDVYLHKIPFYGQTVPEDEIGDNPNSPFVTESHAFTTYLELHNNYTGFPLTGSAAIKVTAAHEFYHAIQIGYDKYESNWMIEATATWSEDEVYDDINDNRNYMPDWFRFPQYPLDAGTFASDNIYDPDLHKYGSWIFFRYLSEHVGGRAAHPGAHARVRQHKRRLQLQ